MTARLMGLETEYACSALNGGSEEEREDLLENLVHKAGERLPHLPAAQTNGIFLANGGKLMIDAGDHPEFCTPEVDNPWDVVRYAVAGDEILARAAAELSGKTRPILLSKCNVDYTGARTTWACHENYSHRANPSLLPRQLLPFLASRIVFSGNWLDLTDPFQAQRPAWQPYEEDDDDLGRAGIVFGRRPDPLRRVQRECDQGNYEAAFSGAVPALGQDTGSVGPLDRRPVAA
jgi:hypothetical protein